MFVLAERLQANNSIRVQLLRLMPEAYTRQDCKAIWVVLNLPFIVLRLSVLIIPELDFFE